MFGYLRSKRALLHELDELKNEHNEQMDNAISMLLTAEAEKTALLSSLTIVNQRLAEERKVYERNMACLLSYLGGEVNLSRDLIDGVFGFDGQVVIKMVKQEDKSVDVSVDMIVPQEEEEALTS